MEKKIKIRLYYANNGRWSGLESEPFWKKQVFEKQEKRGIFLTDYSDQNQVWERLQAGRKRLNRGDCFKSFEGKSTEKEGLNG